MQLIEQKSIKVFNDFMRKISDPHTPNGLMSLMCNTLHNADIELLKAVSLFMSALKPYQREIVF